MKFIVLGETEGECPAMAIPINKDKHLLIWWRWDQFLTHIQPNRYFESYGGEVLVRYPEGKP